MYFAANAVCGALAWHSRAGAAVCLAMSAIDAAVAAAVLIKTRGAKNVLRRRSVMASAAFGTPAVSMVFQAVWPSAPATLFGCLAGVGFFMASAIWESQAEAHDGELEDALVRAREAEKARNAFFSIASHDIRTPLNAILGYSELLRSGIESKAEREEALDSIRASGAALLQLVNDILDLAKADAGKMTFTPAPTRLSSMVEDVFSSLRFAAGEKGIELCNRTADVPALMLDSHRFRQVIFNLAGNAVKFTERGSVTVSASFRSGTLEVSVADTGCGIPADMLAHIFDPFVQVQDRSHTADRASGTGLGLAICRSLAKAMGGDLAVESRPGAGSTFTIRVPGVAVCKEEQSSSSPAPRSPSPAPARLPKRVLVVDDSSVNRKVLSAFLGKAGVAAADQACGGVEALAMLDAAAREGRPYDLVFSDFWMPEMNGLEFMEKLRGDIRFAGVRVFAVTGDTEHSGDARAALFTGILSKPLTYGKLVEVLSA